MLELIRPYSLPFHPRVALFDFDGTLSLIRSGWMPIMVSMFLDEMRALNAITDDEALQARLEEIVLQLTGKETIHQMSALADEIRERGGQPKSPAEYKQIFLERLLSLVNTRLARLRSGEAPPDSFLVPGARNVLQMLWEKGITLYLASGTDEANVKLEADLLDIAKYFGDRIYGARDDRKGFTKGALVAHLLSKAGYEPSELIGLGDGFIEISEVSRAGGFAIGLATDEPECRSIERGKRRYLMAAGANVILPNFESLDEWIPLLSFPNSREGAAR